MFSHTSRPRSRIWGTSVRKHCCFCLFVSCFLLFYNGFEQFLIVFIGFHKVLLCFGCPPFGFSLLFLFPYWFWKENQRKTIGKPIPADSGTSPELPSGPLPPLPALGLLLRDFPWVSPCWPPLGSSGWLCPPPSSLCLLLRVIRKKSDSGASPELRSGALCLFSFTRYGERERGEYRLGWSGAWYPTLPAYLWSHRVHF